MPNGAAGQQQILQEQKVTVDAAAFGAKY